jgi:DNA-binding Lrp family transcriptional regulator
MQTAFVLIDAQPDRIRELAEELAGVEGVAEAYSVAGEADLVAIVRVRRMEELAEVVTGGIAGLAGILHTRTLVAFQSFSEADVAAMWDLNTD